MNTPTDCPSSADLAAFSDGGLEPARRAEVAEHLLRCASCYEVLAQSSALLLELEESPDSQPAGPLPLVADRAARPAKVVRMRRPLLVLAVAAALAVAISIPLARRFAGDSSSGAVPEFASVSWQRRPVEARIAGFDYAPAPVVTRGTSVQPEADVLSAAASVRERVGQRGDAASLHARGIVDLVIGRPADAVERLERAADETPTAERLSDLAAAYLTRGRLHGAVSDYVAAYEASERALVKDPTCAPAAFNRALALEAQRFLRKESIEAWERYLALDGTSPWAEEAKRRRDRLRALPDSQ